MKYADFQQITRRRTLPQPVTGSGDVVAIACSMLAELFPVEKGIRLLGVTLSSLDNSDHVEGARQLALF